MGSTVGTRPNHYELLGLTPTASREEIDEAFAHAMRRPHLMTEVADIGVAFDTLRSASKRRAYDEALGLQREREPRPGPPPAMSFRVSARLAAIASAEPLASPSLLPTAPVAQPQPRPEPVPQPGPQPAPRPQPRPEPLAELWRDLPEAEFGPRIAPRRRSRRLPEVDEVTGGWKYAAFAFGSVLVGVVMVAAWAGAHAQDPGDSDERAPMMAVKHHAADPARVDAGLELKPEAAPSTPLVAQWNRRPARRQRTSVQRLARMDETLATSPQEQAPSDATPTDAPTPAPAVPASLPLPNSVVAHTIDRIGYACGSVALAAATGQHGAYKVTCTSGQSFEAKPVHGRYRFRRL